MARTTAPRRIDLESLAFPANGLWDGTTMVVETDAVDQPTLDAAVAAAPAASREASRATLRQQAQQALAGNRTYVALASPTAAQTTAQVKALSRQQNALIRLVLGVLDGTD